MRIQMKFVAGLDTIGFLDIHSWDFMVRSLIREYGIGFLTKIVFPYPIETVKGIWRYRSHRCSTAQSFDTVTVPQPFSNRSIPIVGAGFCLKSLYPLCVSGRANHDCLYLEEHLYRYKRSIPKSCGHCIIREIGLWSFSAGYSFYIMTSANDILRDLFVPGLVNRRFSNGLFILCRYSFEPFKIALHICGINGQLIPLEKNDCRNYPTWRAADIGLKPEQTDIGPSTRQTIEEWLKQNRNESSIHNQFVKRGNIFYIR